MLQGKKLVITGVVTADSIAFATARRALDLGAEVLLTAPDRDRERAQEAATALGCDLRALDVNDPAGWEALAVEVGDRWGHLDGALHAVAFAPADALDGDFFAARTDSLTIAFHTSASSYAALAGLVGRLAPAAGGSVVGLDFDAAGAWPTYNWMGVMKAALEATSRYAARDLGPRRVRSNLIAAGPLATRAAGGIPGFPLLLQAWADRSPIHWDSTDPGPVADTACFLLSDLARAITGEIIHVDGGYHAMAGPLRASLNPADGADLSPVDSPA
jgi:enoyl ACP reductase